MNKQNSECEGIMNATEKRFSNDKCSVIGIYGLRNKITGKWYVGRSIDISMRWKKYKNYRCKSQKKLYASLVKYGYDSFERIVIKECENVNWILDYREMYWIRQLNSVEDGYNISTGGSTSFTHHTEEVKKRIGDTQRGKPKPKEWRENIRKGKIGIKLEDKSKEKIKTWMKLNRVKKLTHEEYLARAREKYRMRKLGIPYSPLPKYNQNRVSVE